MRHRRCQKRKKGDQRQVKNEETSIINKKQIKKHVSSKSRLLCKDCPLLILSFFTAKSKQDSFLGNHTHTELDDAPESVLQQKARFYSCTKM